jgi:cephalosporin hydroxylase
MNITKQSLELTQVISEKINNQTFHHHYHILYDLPVDSEEKINYLEIGCYAGGSAILMLLRPNTRVVSVDLGHPISKETVLANVSNNNPLENEFHYVQGDSSDESTVDRVKELIPQVDILFIDGNHTYQSVIRDFELYSQLVVTNGYVVFDDYNDAEFSPEVKQAVDDIVKDLENYQIIGTVANTLGARPDSLKDGNCYIIRKL